MGFKEINKKEEWEVVEVIEQDQLHTGRPRIDARKFLHDISYNSIYDDEEIECDLNEGRVPTIWRIRIRVDIQEVGHFEGIPASTDTERKI